MADPDAAAPRNARGAAGVLQGQAAPGAGRPEHVRARRAVPRRVRRAHRAARPRLGSLSGAVEDFARFKKPLGGNGRLRRGRREQRASIERPRGERRRHVPRPRSLQTKAFAGHLVSLDASRAAIPNPAPLSPGGSSAPPCAPAAKTGSTTAWACAAEEPARVRDVRPETRAAPAAAPRATAGCSSSAGDARAAARAPPPRGGPAGGHAALPQPPCVVVEGLVGATARVALADGVQSDRMKRTSRRVTSAKASPRRSEGRSYAATSIRRCLSLAHASVGSFARHCWTTALGVRYGLGSAAAPVVRVLRVLLKIKTRLSSRTRARAAHGDGAWCRRRRARGVEAKRHRRDHAADFRSGARGAGLALPGDGAAYREDGAR